MLKTDSNILSYANAAQEKITPYVTSVKQAATVTVVSARDVFVTSVAAGTTMLNKYPPVKAFVYTLAGFAALPLAVFTGYGLITAAIFSTIALTLFAVTQGSFLAVGAFVLFWFLMSALFFASIISFWFTAGYFTFQVAKKLE